MSKNKIECRQCSWRGVYSNLLVAPSPFDPEERIFGCPLCKQCMEGFESICDVDDCKDHVVGGFMNKDGEYTFACYKHYELRRPNQ